MENKDKFERLADLVDQVNAGKVPEEKVHRIKTDRGLIERAENTKVLITEDNKFLLND